MWAKALVATISSGISIIMPVILNDRINSTILTLIVWLIIIVAVVKLAKVKRDAKTNSG